MSNSPLVSIIVITYNSERYVLETLESTKNQTYQNIELIISDDGSRDSTLSLCEEWIRTNGSRFVHCELIRTDCNTGIPANCNRGWKASAGSWIKLIAGDDILLPECLEKNMSFATNNTDITILYSEAVKIDENGNYLPESSVFYKNELNGWRLHFFNQDTSKQLKLFAREPIFLVSPTVFIKKDLLVQINGFDEHLRIFEDIILIIKSLENNHRIYYFPEKTVLYRLHNASISKKKSPKLQLNGITELEYIYRHYRRNHLHPFNIFDLSCMVHAWFIFDYAIKFKLKGARFFTKLNVFLWYQHFVSKKTSLKQKKTFLK